MRILLAPDKFKGTLTAQEVCEAITFGIHDFDQTIEVLSHPLADGGEGTLDLLESVLKLERVPLNVRDPLNRTIESYYLRQGATAYIEMALASGLQLLKPQERNPLLASTYGTGQLIKHAIEGGAQQVYLMIGGSATNDGGTGMAQALGFKFKSADGALGRMCGDNLQDIREIEDPTNDLLNGVKFTVLTDVQNVLLGTSGASFVYAGQKGADEEMMVALDHGLGLLSAVLDNGFEKVPGAGAAGGLGYGALSFLGASLKSGIQSVMEITDFEESLKDVDLIITGEGKMDLQTVEGKVIAGVSEKAIEKGIPFGVICGMAEARDLVQQQIKAWGIYPLANEFVAPAEAMTRSFELVKARANELIRDFLA